MRRLFLVLTFAVIASAGYVAAPFVSAWHIREAIRHGNSSYLADKVEWESLKASLKPSLSRIALDIPLEPDVQPAKKPGLWQRIKQRWGKPFVDRAVDGYVTPEGLTQLFSLRKMYRDKVAGTGEPDAGKPLLDRVKGFWSRVRRAEFTTPTRFELDVVDRHQPTRMFAGVLELRGIDWKLTELRIRDTAKPADDPSAPGSVAGDTEAAAPPTLPLASAEPGAGSPQER